MSEHHLTGHGGPDHRFVLIAIEDETLQAMWCVALEMIGFQPIAAADDEEALALAAVLPRNPLALVITYQADSGEGPRGRLARLRRGHRGSTPPTLVLERPASVPGEPARVQEVPDFATGLEALQTLAVG